MAVGITAYGTYLPYWQLARSAIRDVLGAGGGKGLRTVASYDEDTTSMGVEAARHALRTLPPDGAVEAVVLATSAPAYLDKTNAVAVHAALGLDPSGSAYDMAGAVRSGVGALRAALDAAAAGRSTLAVLSDVRTGLPGGSEEAHGGDAAAAFVCGAGDTVVAELLGAGSATTEFLDRWRIPGEPASHVWEERFGEGVYLSLAGDAFAAACKQAGVSAGEVDHLVVAGVHRRAARTVGGLLGAPAEAAVDDLSGVLGNPGAAQAGVLLADVLDRAEPGRVIAVLVLADGADCLVLRTTEHLAQRRSSPTLRSQLETCRADLPYATFLSWRGFLDREPPRRPDPEAPAAPPSFRSEAWKFAFTGSRCEGCGTRHLPPQRVCRSCHAVDRMVPERLADVPGTIVTYTVDRLAFSPSPPVVVGVVDFDGGGRLQCELTDVDPAAVAIGDRVEMTFRRLVTAGGVHNYFWKARPMRGA